ncbi:Fasciclin-like arabinogalactan protein 11 [Orobanche minor]
MTKLLLQTFALLLVILHATPISAQSPAVAPSPAGPINLTAILDKAGQFTTFIRLLQNTKVSDQINTQLNNSNQGLTIFAPTDNAFSGLKPGILNSFSDQQKVELIQFHVLPSVLSASDFQTASNPLRTQAGGSQGSFQLNVTTSGNQVNITTGVTNATVANTVYTDSQLAVYQVDQVLLPLAFFTSPAPAPAPSSKSRKAARSGDSQSDDSTPADSSSGVSRSRKLAEAIIACLVLVLVGFA